MAWQIDWDIRASRELRKLDKQVQRQIIEYLDERIASGKDPKDSGEALIGDLKGLWRYWIGDYRVICKITSARLNVLVIRVAHRRQVYKSK